MLFPFPFQTQSQLFLPMIPPSLSHALTPNPSHDLPVVRQCQILTISRSTAYYKARPVSQDNLQLMRRLDELHLEYPFMWSRQLRDQLKREECFVSRGRISRLMRLMGISAIYRKPNTSKPHPAHPIYPYLLRNLVIDRPNQVWATDITYIPMSRGFVYLCAVMDWASRKVLAWRLSNTLTTDFCIEAVQEAIARHGTPEIFNTDQGSQFTSFEFTELLQQHGIRSAWMAGVAGGTTCSLSDCGRVSSTRKFTCMRTTA